MIVAGFFCYAYSVDRPEQNARVNSSELALISGPAETEAGPVQKNISQKIRVPWRRVFSNSSIWTLMVSHFCLVYPRDIFFTWFFIYLVKVRGGCMVALPTRIIKKPFSHPPFLCGWASLYL